MKYSILYIFILLTTFSFSQCPATPGGSCDGSGTSLDLYWVGTDASNNGNWNSPCSWRVGSILGVEPCQSPRSIDNVFFVAGSFIGGVASTITINTPVICNNLLVDPVINALAFTPNFSLINPGFLEVYGSFTLQNNINWLVTGGNNSGPELLFKSSNAGNTIKTGGKIMGAVQFDGNGGEWALQDDFNAGSLNFVLGFLNTSDGVNDYDMNLLTFDSDVQAGGSNANRRIDLNASVITLSGSTGNDRYPYNTTNSAKTVWECRGTDNSDLTFNASNSKIIFTTASPFLRLGGLTYNVIKHTGTGRFYDHFGPNPCIIDTLETNGYLYFHHAHTFNVLKINSVSKTHNFFQSQTINTDLISSGNVCNPTIFKSEYNRLLTMPAVVSADPMNGFTIDNLRCNDGTVGHALGGNGLGTTTGWTITPPAIRNLYWVGGTNNNWSEPTNWSTSPTGTPLLLAIDCSPSQTDNVFFIPTLANGATVTLDQTATCNNQIWTITSPATFNGGAVMNIYGDLQLDTEITFNCTSSFNFFGTSGNTIFSAGKTLQSTSYIKQFADYTLLDDLNFTNLYLFRQNNFNSGGFNMTGARLYFRAGTQDFSGSAITLSNNIPWYIAGSQGTTNYNSASQVIFTYTGSITGIYGWGPSPYLPNFTLQSPNTTLRFSTHFKNRSMVFDGDVILMGSARFRADYAGGTSPGALATLVVNGNLTLNADKLYEFNITADVDINGDLSANGTCTDAISLQGILGTSFGIDISGVATLDYCNISDMNSISAITATNSLDAGNNTNITFPLGVSSTYYWRALSGSCPSCNYNGNWNSSAGYWTTNAANVEGTPGCIPTAADNVVFDNMSFNASQSSITISTVVSCHDITVTATNVKFIGAGNLKITGSIISDGTLLASPFTGILDFISNDITGETIDFGGVTLGCDVNFSNPTGNWTLQNNKFLTTKDLFLNSGTLNTNNETLEVRRFNSNNSSVRSLNLSGSIFNITGTGNFISHNFPSNLYTWNTNNITNFTFNAGTSSINFTNANEPTVFSSALNLHHVNFTSTSSIVNSSPVLDIGGWNTQYLKFDCSARIYGNNSYDTLNFTAGNVYKIEGGSTQTLNAPNGKLIATGTGGNAIAIKSLTTGIPATFHKLNTGGTMASFCFDYVSVEDNFASSDDPAFSFFTGVNSNNISASGVWDFSNSVFINPSVTSASNQYICAGSSATILFPISGSGPYSLTYTENGINPTTVTLPHGTPFYSVNVNPLADTEYQLTTFTANNCGTNVVGTIIDNNQFVYLPSASPIANHNDTSSCNLNNEGVFIDFHETVNGSERPLASILDKVTGSGLGSISVSIQVDGTVQSTIPGRPYLQRRYGIKPTTNEAATVRLYFTQTELNALSTALGSPLNLSDLRVTKYANNNMDFTGAATLITPTASGNIPGGITTSLNVLYLEIEVPSFSHFVIHPSNGFPLPVTLTNFSAVLQKNIVNLTWQTSTEINNDYFTLEKSTDGYSFNAFLKQPGAGNSNTLISYNGVDESPSNGISYYRLKQTDFNGEFEYSKIVSINYAKEGVITAYPNPVKDILSFTNITEQHDIKVYTSNGQIVYNGNTKTINTENWSTGLYQVVISDATGKLIQKIKVVK